MWACAELDKISLLIEGNDFILWEVLDELDFVWLISLLK